MVALAGIRMKTTKIESPLSRLERQRLALERRILAFRRKALMALPSRVGLDSVDSLILALAEHASPAMRSRFKAAGILDGTGPHAETISDGSRAKFSSELREMIKKELLAGGKSVAELARQYGPSHPTIMGWKREWGMTHPRPKRAGSNGGRQ